MRATDRDGTATKGVAGVVATILALTALGIAPAAAAQFLTKQKADKRYLGNTSVVTATQTVPADEGTTFTLVCPGGRQGTGGGANSPAFINNNSTGEGMLLLERRPLMSGGRSLGWVSEVLNASSGPLQITGYAVCAP